MTGLFPMGDMPLTKAVADPDKELPLADKGPTNAKPTWFGLDPASGSDFGLVQIGPHRLYHGDAYAIRPTLGYMDCHCIDPPYEFNNSGGGKWRKERSASDQIIDEGLTEGFYHLIINPLVCGQTVVFFHANQRFRLEGYLRGSFHRHILMNWVKTNPTPHHNRNFIAGTEEFFLAWSEDGSKNYFHTWQRGSHPVGDKHHDFHRYAEYAVAPSKTQDHPTVKPDKVMDKIMANINDQTIFDPFMGTGSTGVAAIKAGKTFTGIEHNSKHFETAVERITQACEAVNK